MSVCGRNWHDIECNVGRCVKDIYNEWRND